MTQQEIAQAFTDAPTPVGTVKLPRWGRIGKALGLYKRVELSIKTIPVGKVQLIGVHLKDMTSLKDIQSLPQADQINTLLAENIEPLLRIVALAVSEGKTEPSKYLIDAMARQLTMKQVEMAIYEVYRRLDLTPFFDILSLTKNLTLSLFPDQEVRGQA
jgi:hypothetical protein